MSGEPSSVVGVGTGSVVDESGSAVGSMVGDTVGSGETVGAGETVGESVGDDAGDCKERPRGVTLSAASRLDPPLSRARAALRTRLLTDNEDCPAAAKSRA